MNNFSYFIVIAIINSATVAWGMDFSYRQRDSRTLNQYRARVDLVTAQMTHSRAPQSCVTNGTFNTQMEAMHHNAHLPLPQKIKKVESGTKKEKKKDKKKKKKKNK